MFILPPTRAEIRYDCPPSHRTDEANNQLRMGRGPATKFLRAKRRPRRRRNSQSTELRPTDGITPKRLWLRYRLSFSPEGGWARTSVGFRESTSKQIGMQLLDNGERVSRPRMGHQEISQFYLGQ